ncbi:MAG: hypothetical protein ACI97N_002161 [Cognaticolwellia sp.]|jgi:hypothetical protein|tara:strand:- start:262 stop:1080 length:819 start_codon:yes stop_codon:yes gene_type:complete
MKNNKTVTNRTDLYSDNNNLFVLIGANRLSYFITSPEKVILLQSIEQLDTKTFASFFDEEQYFDTLFATVKVGFVTPYTTLVPNLIYTEGSATSYLENSFSIPHQHYLLIDNLASLQCQNVFLAPIEIYDFLQNKFDHIEFYHAETPLLTAWQKEAVQFQQPTIFINVIGRQFQIAAFQQEKLLLSNTFEFKSAKDFIYYTLLVFNQLNLSTENSKLFLSGEVMQNSRIYKLLYRYIRKIEFISRPTAFQFDEQFADQPKHFNFDLYSFYTV